MDHDDTLAAEIELIQAAYTPQEAWITHNNDAAAVAIHRRLRYDNLSWLLQIDATTFEVSATVECSEKLAYDILPHLVKACQEYIIEQREDYGGVSLWSLLQYAQEWIDDGNVANLVQMTMIQPGVAERQQRDESAENYNSKAVDEPIVLGRRLIYSHHIIAKSKRSDIMTLARQYKLTGYLKIGWPGLIIIEGCEADCQAFYDEIRPWSWQYLVVRGEMQENVDSIESGRRFDDFVQVDDMSIVANACKQVGLEDLFKTSMKVYSNDNDEDDGSNMGENNTDWYGCLVHVDHMNNGKAYRKLLRRYSEQRSNVKLLIKQAYSADDTTNRPIIIVAAVSQGSVDSISAFLKYWRTTRVDVDSQGKPCLERKMKILLQAKLDQKVPDRIDWNKACSEDDLDVTIDVLKQLLLSIGGETWLEAMTDVTKNP